MNLQNLNPGKCCLIRIQANKNLKYMQNSRHQRKISQIQQIDDESKNEINMQSKNLQAKYQAFNDMSKKKAGK